MPDNLSTIGITVDHQPETIISKAKIMGNFACHLMNMANQLIICRCQIKNRPDMLAGNNKQVIRSLWVYILNND